MSNKIPGYPNINQSFDGYHLPSGSFYPGSYIEFVNKTLFGETRIAEKYPQAIYKSVLNKSNLRDLYRGTVNKNNGKFILKGTTEVSELVTKKRGDYIPGLEFEAGNGIRLKNKSSSYTAQYGYRDNEYDQQIAAMIEQTETGRRIKIIDQPTGFSETIEQEDWNWGFLEHPNPKEIDNPLNADLSSNNMIIYQVRFAYYGGGPIIFYAITYDGYGNFIPVILHVFRREGNVTLSNSNLFLHQYADGVDMEVGGRQMGPLGNEQKMFRTVENRKSHEGDLSLTGGVWHPVISCRIKTDFRNAYVKMNRFSVQEADFAGYCAVFIDPELTDADFGAAADVPAGEDTLEWDTAATAMNINNIWAISGLGRFTGSVGNRAGGSAVELFEKEITEFDTVTLAILPDADGSNLSLESILGMQQAW